MLYILFIFYSEIKTMQEMKIISLNQRKKDAKKMKKCKKKLCKRYKS
ncbi:protein of unknown function [Bartonella clarridgeiae 73]|uniref:Uncharacterized protein n=1 Tax=Bartonella clarridgeiae (strain CCUG 45776 / CIP 104772 / 73) TaxID=696125 RepID=E6YFR9_BARC7|nr:protein of unknown function [Bartonella clarridgeiae 73]